MRSVAVFVVAALVISYPIDPYVFAFTALGLAWATGAMAIVAMGAMAAWAWDWSWTRRLLVAAGVVMAIAAIERALAILRTFKWA